MIRLTKIGKDNYDKSEQFGNILSFKLKEFEFDITKYKTGWIFSLSKDNLYDLEFLNKEGIKNQKECDAYMGTDWYELLYQYGN